MSIIGNILWFILGGFLISILYIIGGLALCLTIVGIPFGWQIIKLSWLGCAPFGKIIVYDEKSTGCVAIGLNVIWILCGGIWIAAVHLLFALLCGLTIIGLPFARQHMKLMAVATSPFGALLRDPKEIREAELAQSRKTLRLDGTND